LLQTVEFPELLGELLLFPSVPDEFDVRDRILQWLAPSISQQRQRDLSQYCVPGTGEWLLSREEYQGWTNWLQHPNNILWCHGEPGSGKSMLTWVAFCPPGKNYPTNKSTV